MLWSKFRGLEIQILGDTYLSPRQWEEIQHALQENANNNQQFYVLHLQAD